MNALDITARDLQAALAMAGPDPVMVQWQAARERAEAIRDDKVRPMRHALKLYGAYFASRPVDEAIDGTPIFLADQLEEAREEWRAEIDEMRAVRRR